MITYVFFDLCLKAKVLRAKLQNQGIDGPKPGLILGNITEMQKIKSIKLASDPSIFSLKEPPSLDCSSVLFPHFIQWSKQYGKTFTFALGKVQILYIADPSLVREINISKTLDLGKPAYLQKDRGPLLGKGLITTNREVWSHQRKTIARNLFVDKVKNMLSIVLESGSKLIKSLENVVGDSGKVAEIKVDDYVRDFTCHVFSTIMFGEDYPTNTGLFSKCRALILASGSPTILNGRPFYRFLPTKQNKEQWRLEKEIYSVIIETTRKCTMSGVGEGMIHKLVDGSSHGELGSSTPQEFIVDNCKDLYLAAFEVTGIASIWGLMLLACHPDWQARARAEVLELCGREMPDAEKLSKMKVLKMIIQEVLRLYPGVAFVSREALADVQIGKLCVPKGVNIWIWLLALHRDTQLWGPDADQFNPKRFVNGISAACKSPQAYVPFGVGPRICPGMSLAMLEMKVMFAVMLANFSFSLSPNYRHVPNFGLLLEPKYGVQLLVRKL